MQEQLLWLFDYIANVSLHQFLFSLGTQFGCSNWYTSIKNLNTLLLTSSIFMWGTHLYMSPFPSVAHHILGTVYHVILILVRICKMIIPLGVFFHFFKILIFRVVIGVKGQIMSQNDKKLCHASYLRNRTSCDCHLWCACV